MDVGGVEITASRASAPTGGKTPLPNQEEVILSSATPWKSKTLLTGLKNTSVIARPNSANSTPPTLTLVVLSSADKWIPILPIGTLAVSSVIVPKSWI